MPPKARPGEVRCSACSGLKKENLEAHLLRSVKGKKPAEGRGCQRCARLALKELNIGDDKDMVGSKMEKKKETTTTKNPRPDEFESAAGSEESPKKRRKKVMMRLSKEYVEYLEKHPPPPPYKPVKSIDIFFCEDQDLLVAEETAERQERDRILKQYKELGCAYKEFEVTDDEADEDL